MLHLFVQCILYLGLAELARLLRFLLPIAGIVCCVSSWCRHEEARHGTAEEARRSWQRLHGHVPRWLMVVGLTLYLIALTADVLGWSVAYTEIRMIADTAYNPTSPGNILRYMLIGVGAEGCFTMAHDRKSYGYSSPWYVLVYWTIPLWATWTHRNFIGELPFWLRGFVHMGAIYAGEFVGMALLRRLNGRSPSQDEYEAKRWNYRGLIRLDLWYAWYAAGLIFELLVVSQPAGQLPRYDWWF